MYFSDTFVNISGSLILKCIWKTSTHLNSFWQITLNNIDKFIKILFIQFRWIRIDLSWIFRNFNITCYFIFNFWRSFILALWYSFFFFSLILWFLLILCSRSCPHLMYTYNRFSYSATIRKYTRLSVLF